ncbi:MAG: YHS domain-containing protein [Candidatus Micrarchaeota archaeon]|nr:YHS domain-containing protein [Candidatus Micrarchaeota archaeon]
MKDPICGMEVDKSSRFMSEYHNKRYLFCSVSCKETFDKNPQKFVK